MACTQLSSTEKLIWIVHYTAIRSGAAKGTMASAIGIAMRAGVARVTVERARLLFMTCGLMRKHNRGLGKSAELFPELPLSCRPSGDRIDDDNLQRFAEILDHYIGPLIAPLRQTRRNLRVHSHHEGPVPPRSLDDEAIDQG